MDPLSRFPSPFPRDYHHAHPSAFSVQSSDLSWLTHSCAPQQCARNLSRANPVSIIGDDCRRSTNRVVRILSMMVDTSRWVGRHGTEAAVVDLLRIEIRGTVPPAPDSTSCKITNFAHFRVPPANAIIPSEENAGRMEWHRPRRNVHRGMDQLPHG
jgi:hypothetical protein